MRAACHASQRQLVATEGVTADCVSDACGAHLLKQLLYGMGIGLLAHVSCQVCVLQGYTLLILTLVVATASYCALYGM